jgi:hypothetical protein
MKTAEDHKRLGNEVVSEGTKGIDWLPVQTATSLRYKYPYSRFAPNEDIYNIICRT